MNKRKKNEIAMYFRHFKENNLRMLPKGDERYY